MWQKFFSALRENLAVILDAITALIAIIVVFRIPADSPDINRWILVVLGLIAISGVANRLGVFNSINKNTEGLVDAIKELSKPRVGSSLLKTYKELPPLEDRLQEAHTIWLSGRLFSSLLGFHKDMFKDKICNESCSVRILVIDPKGKVAQAEKSSHNGEESLEQVLVKAETFNYRLDALKKAIGTENSRKLEVRVLDYSPRFDLMITNAEYIDGVVQIQLLTHWDDTASRPILRISKNDISNGIWFYKFVSQFQRLWDIATPVPEKQDSAGAPTT